MPPCQRRSGYEPSRQLSLTLEAAIDDEAARLAAFEDPAEAVRAVSDPFIALEDALEVLAGPRLAAVAKLYRPHGSYGEVAKVTGLSKTRVAHLYKEARSRGL